MAGPLLSCATVLALALAAVARGQAPDNPAVTHAKHVFDLLTMQQFDDVAKELNAQMAAAINASQLRDIWSSIQAQAGNFVSYVDDRVATPSPGVTAVVLGCRFEKATLNALVAFDADNRIAGLRLTPRQNPAPPATPPPSNRFTEEAVTVGSGGWQLPGTLTLPIGPIAAAVVLVHGSGPNDRNETIGANAPFRDLAWGLGDRGIAVLRYDKRTRVYGARMAGDTSMTVREETTDDALRAVSLLRHHDRIDPRRIVVLGHSLGGNLAPRIAAEDSSLAGIVIMAGSTRPLLESAREQLAYLSSLNPGTINQEQALQSLRKAAPDSYWKDLDAYKPAETAAHLTLPILILQGERDYQVTPADLRGWREALGNHPNVTIKTYPTLNHLFMPGEGTSTPAEYQQPSHIPDFVLDDIGGWIKQSVH